MASKHTTTVLKVISDNPGRYRAVRSFTEQELLGFVTQILQEKFQRGEPISQPAEFRALLTAQLATLEFEIFWIAFLDLCAAKDYVQ